MNYRFSDLSKDYLIDLGPEGGMVIAAGTPEDVALVEKSYTGQFLRSVLNIGNRQLAIGNR